MTNFRRTRVGAGLVVIAIVLGCFLSMSWALAVERLNASDVQSLQTYGRIIVKFRDTSAEYRNLAVLQQSLDRAAQVMPSARAGGGALHLTRFFRMALGADVITLNRKLDHVDIQTLLRQLVANPMVEYAEIDGLNQPAFVPNDSLYLQQWHYYEPIGGINLPKAWDVSKGAGVVVAVIDTGITTHSDLSANVMAGYDFISDTWKANDGGGRDSDATDAGDAVAPYDCSGADPDSHPSTWHGTHVAGTVAAVTNNAKGVAGVAYQAKIVPVRVLGKCGGFDSDISDAIIWASGGSVSGVPANANPAEVINLSLGGLGSCPTVTQAAINAAVGRGTTVVISAGNSGQDVINYKPANCLNGITVAANDRLGRRAGYSNYGTRVDVTAPGGNGSGDDIPTNGVMSTLNSFNPTRGVEGYLNYSGTSMAAPHVAGVVALMQSKAITPMTPAVIESTLKSSARPMPGDCYGGCGAGIVDAYAALMYPSVPNPLPLASYTVTTKYLTAAFTDTSKDTSGSIVSRLWSFDDGTTSTATNPGHSFAKAGSYYVSLIVTDNGGATSAKVTRVTITAPVNSRNGPTVSFTTAFNGLTATFTDTTTPKDTYVYFWNFGDGGTSTAANPSHTYAAPGGVFNVSLTITNDANQIVTKTQSVTVGTPPPNLAPVSNFSLGNTQSSKGTVLTFNDLATDLDGTILTRVWNYGDGSTFTTSLTRVFHAYATPGIYLVSYTVTDDRGATNTKTAYVRASYSGITPNYPPMVDFTYSVVNRTATFTDISRDEDGTIVSRYWTFGDGSTSTATNPVHTYAQDGTYTVTLKATDNGGSYLYKTKTVVIGTGNTAPVANFSFAINGWNVTFNDLSTDSGGSIASRSWAFGDGSTSTSTNPVHFYDDCTTYNVVLTVTDNQGATGTVTKPVHILCNEPPIANFSFTINSLTATFKDLSIDEDGSIVSRLWNFGDGTATSSTTNPVHAYAVCGTYNVTLTATDNTGATNAVTKAVTIVCSSNKPPVAAFTSYTLGNTVAERLIGRFTDGSTDSDGTIVTRVWNFGDGSTLTTPIINPTHTYAAIGFYVVTLTVTDNKGVTNAITHTVSVGFLP